VLGAPAAAARFYDGALELWPEEDPERAELMLRAADARWWTGAGSDVAQQATEARDLLLATGHEELAAEAELLLANVQWYGAERERASEHLTAARGLVDALPPSQTKAHVLAQVARFHMLGGEPEDAVTVGREALQMADDLGLDGIRSSALTTMGTSRASRGDDGGIQDLERSIENARDAKNVPEHGRALLNLGVVRMVRGELAQAFELEQESLALGRATGEAVGLRFAEGNMIKSFYWRGEWDESVRLADSFVVEAEAGSVHYLAAQAYYFRAAMRVARGEAGVVEDLERALELARYARDPQVVNPTRFFAGQIFMTVGQRERARDLFSEIADVEELDVEVPLGFCELAWMAFDLDRSSDLLPHLAEVHSTPWREAARAIAGGEPIRAAETLEGIGAGPEAAYSRMRSREPAEVEQALVFYRSVGASRYVHDCEQLLAATA
jgi:tetratricopeptide (TPR) repeat protein